MYHLENITQGSRSTLKYLFAIYLTPRSQQSLRKLKVRHYRITGHFALP